MASSSFSQSDCVNYSEAQLLYTDNAQSSSTGKVLSAVLLTAIFTLLFGSLIVQERGTPILKTPNLSGEVPRYLLYSKLLFYDLR